MAKTALITGASSGIGKEIARQLSSVGFRVILAARRRDRLNALAEELGNARAVPCDLSKKEECLRLYELVKEEKVTLLVNGAGFGKIGEFKDVPLETELDMINTNITALHILTKLFLKDFVKADRGYILNIASSAGLTYGGPMLSTYYATKAYVVSLTGAIYEELRSSGSKVHISALCPGPVDTEFNSVANCKFTIKAISAEYCAKKALEGLFGGKMIIIPEKTMKLTSAGMKLAPRKVVLAVTKHIQKSKMNSL